MPFLQVRGFGLYRTILQGQTQEPEEEDVDISIPGASNRKVAAFNARRLFLAVFAAVALLMAIARAWSWKHMGLVKHDQEPSFLDKYNHTIGDVWKNKSSLFCFMVVQPGMEMELAKFQFKKRTGIFQCNHWAVYSDGPPKAIVLGVHHDGTVEKTIPIPGPPAMKGMQTCLGCASPKPYIMNANVLMRAWDKAAKDGIAGQHAWIVKVDADSMMSPQRLVEQIKEHGKYDVPDLWPGRFFKNCQILNSMQGPVEILSRQAFYNFVANKYKCYQNMDWTHMGEDIFTLHCLQQLGVWSTLIPSMLHDQYCTYSGFPNCWESKVAVFHPLKNLEGQGDCWWKMNQIDEKERKAKEAAAAAIATAAPIVATAAPTAAAPAASTTTAPVANTSAMPAGVARVHHLFLTKKSTTASTS